VALGRKGFRPFFLLAAAHALVGVPLWVLVIGGHAPLATSLPAQTWHAHEMLFGYAAAVIAGFLLTAVANWTKRETLVGAPLLALAALWVLGRVLLLTPAVPAGLAAAVDLAFLPAVALAIARPILLAENRRNVVMIGVLVALTAANGVVHLDGLGVLPGFGRRATLAALHLIVLLMLLITTRVLPLFTRNALGRSDIHATPALDRAAIAATLAVAISDFVWGDAAATPWLCLLAALLVALRTRYWGTRAAFGEPMLWILHLGHAWIAVGLLLKAMTPLLAALASSAIHAFTAGALGCLTLGMMARVSLGHTGRIIAASASMRAAFFAMLAAGVVRVIAPLLPAPYFTLLAVSAALWALAFALFLGQFTPVLVRPRVDGAPG
jgi:uncharacterized protein involved in response to NO